MAPDTFTVGFVTGASPDKWARAWREQRREPLVLVPTTEHAQLDGVRDASQDCAIVRLPVDHDRLRSADPPLHRVPLYEEQVVVVAGREHWVAAADVGEPVALLDLAEEQLVAPHVSGWRPRVGQLDWPAMDEREAVRTVAAGTGVVLLPAAVGRLLARRDVVSRPVQGLATTTVALAWRVDRDGERVQAFVGILKGRTARSSRG